MALSRAHTSAKAADVAKLLLLNKRQVTSSHAQYGGTLPGRNAIPHVTWFWLPPKSSGFSWPCASFLPNFV